MRQLFTEAEEWEGLAGEAFPGYTGYDPGTSRPRMKEWAAPPERPSPGAEPRLRDLRGGEGASAALSELSQRHKEWGTAC